MGSLCATVLLNSLDLPQCRRDEHRRLTRARACGSGYRTQTRRGLKRVAIKIAAYS